MEYSSARKRVHTITWMDLKIVMLSIRSHTRQTSSEHAAGLIENTGKCKLTHSDRKKIRR